MRLDKLGLGALTQALLVALNGIPQARVRLSAPGPLVAPNPLYENLELVWPRIRNSRCINLLPAEVCNRICLLAANINFAQIVKVLISPRRRGLRPANLPQEVARHVQAQVDGLLGDPIDCRASRLLRLARLHGLKAKLTAIVTKPLSV